MMHEFNRSAFPLQAQLYAQHQWQRALKARGVWPVVVEIAFIVTNLPPYIPVGGIGPSAWCVRVGRQTKTSDLWKGSDMSCQPRAVRQNPVDLQNYNPPLDYIYSACHLSDTAGHPMRQLMP